MKILSPLSRVAETQRLIRAGADEFYCGVFPESWRNRYPANATSVNRREWEFHQMASYDELAEAVSISHDNDVRVFLCLNALYNEQQVPAVLEEAQRAAEIHVDALLVADIGVLSTLAEMKLPLELIVSTGGTTFNSETAKFYAEMGASRIVLPRHLTLQQIEPICTQVPELEFEVFILNERCYNIDGFCTFLHGITYLGVDPANLPNACGLPYRISSLEEDPGDSDQKRRFDGWYVPVETGKSPNYCGVCALHDLERFGVTSAKIVGRGRPLDKKIADVKYLRAAIELLGLDGITREDYVSRVKQLFEERFGNKHICHPAGCSFPFQA